MRYLVHIKRKSDDSIEKTIDCGSSENKQSRVMMGASINLNHDEFYIDTEDKE